MIKPTIGRVMWFWPVASERGAQPYASMVVYVHDDNMVNLVAFTTDGAPFPAGSVAIVHDGSPYVAGDLPYAEWMPYQVGQARKHADDDAKVAQSSAASDTPPEKAAAAIAKPPADISF
jgi:hypothetical protein